MKAAFVLLLATLVAASEVKLHNGVRPQKLVDVSEMLKQEIDWDHLKEVALNEGELRSGYVVADVTEYALEVLANLQVFIVEKGLDPMALSDQKVNLIPTGTIKLTDGNLTDLSSISLSDKVTVQYSMSTKVLDLTLPLAFDTLLITYDYTTTIALLKITGSVAGKISEVQLDLTMGFNFSCYHAFVNDINMKNSGSGYIVADVTDYALEVITNLQVLLIEKGFEPMELADQKINLIPTGDIKLTEGYFSDLSTIKLSDEVMVKYSMDNKILELTLPLAFDTLLINYDYKTTIILLKITGTVAAKITEVRLGLTMGFNFSSYHAFVDEINMKNSGSISFKFTGLGLLDWVIDAMSVVLLTLFKGIVLSVINTVIYIPVHSVVNTINSFIDEILLRNGTAFF